MTEPTFSMLLALAADDAAAAGSGGGVIYGLFNLLHQLLRWAVLVFGIFALVKAFKGGPWGGSHRGTNIAYMASVHLNVVVGLVLFSGLSPMTTAAFADMGGAMKDSVLRFYAVEHPFLMVLAAVFATVGNIKGKRGADDAAKHKAVKIFFSISLLLILLGIPWPFREAGRSLFHLAF